MLLCCAASEKDTVWSHCVPCVARHCFEEPWKRAKILNLMMTLWDESLDRLMEDVASQTDTGAHSICHQTHRLELFDDGNWDMQIEQERKSPRTNNPTDSLDDGVDDFNITRYKPQAASGKPSAHNTEENIHLVVNNESLLFILRCHFFLESL